FPKHSLGVRSGPRTPSTDFRAAARSQGSAEPDVEATVAGGISDRGADPARVRQGAAAHTGAIGRARWGLDGDCVSRPRHRDRDSLMMRARLKLSRWHQWITAHLWATLALSVLVLCAGASLYRRGATEQDIGALLPGGPGSPREAVRLLGEFGVLNTLLLDLEVPGATQDQLAEAGEKLAEELRRSGDFAEVLAGEAERCCHGGG